MDHLFGSLNYRLRLFFLLANCLLGTVLFAQQDQLLTPEAYLARVFAYHPEALRADLLDEVSEATMLLARGGFDPVAYGDYLGKTFKETNYWDIAEGGVYVPTVGGLELYGGYRTATGDFLSDERSIPLRGQAFAGIKANLLQGLITDERRTGLQRARLLSAWNQVERRAIRNELAFSAMLAYLDFSYSNEEIDLLESTVALAAERQVQTVIGFEAGDRAALDTLEAEVQRQQRELELAEARLIFMETSRNVAQFLWDDPNDPMAFVIPESPLELNPLIVNFTARTTVSNILNNPELLAYDFKLTDLSLEGRLKRQKLLPKLSVKYEAIGDAFDFTPKDEEGNSIGNFILNDNKFEVAFTTSLFMRSARGDVKLNELKQQDTELLRINKLRTLEQKRDQYFAQLDLLNVQLARQRSLVTDYRRLLDAERIKFRVGDSSVFLVNSRENKWLEARLKLLKTEKDVAKIYLTLNYIAGDLGSW